MSEADFVDLATPLVAAFEGCAAKKRDGLFWPYLDRLAKPPVWTRGFGRCYGITEDSPGITRAQAEDELKVGLRAYGMKVLSYAPALATRPLCWAAATSWAWNCGTGAFKVSRLRKAINEGRWEDAADLILKPNTAGGVVFKGLLRRRLAEREMFVAGLK